MLSKISENLAILRELNIKKESDEDEVARNLQGYDISSPSPQQMLQNISNNLNSNQGNPQNFHRNFNSNIANSHYNRNCSIINRPSQLNSHSESQNINPLAHQNGNRQTISSKLREIRQVFGEIKKENPRRDESEIELPIPSSPFACNPGDNHFAMRDTVSSLNRAPDSPNNNFRRHIPPPRFINSVNATSGECAIGGQIRQIQSPPSMSASTLQYGHLNNSQISISNFSNQSSSASYNLNYSNTHRQQTAPVYSSVPGENILHLYHQTIDLTYPSNKVAQPSAPVHSVNLENQLASSQCSQPASYPAQETPRNQSGLSNLSAATAHQLGSNFNSMSQSGHTVDYPIRTNVIPQSILINTLNGREISMNSINQQQLSNQISCNQPQSRHFLPTDETQCLASRNSSTMTKSTAIESQTSSQSSRYSKATFDFILNQLISARDSYTTKLKNMLEKCEICGLDRRVYKVHCRHREVDFEILNYAQIPYCDYDGKIFESMYSFIQHMDSHLTFQCPQCDRVMKRSSMKAHLKYFHTTDKKFKCDLCQMSFKNESLMKRHVGVHEMKFECEVCKKRFSSRRGLMEHFNCYHSDDKKVQFRCQICDKKFTRNTGLNEHLKIHDKTTPKRFKCDRCDYRTNTPHFFQKHQRSHVLKDQKYAEIENPVKCSKCPAHLSNENALKHHMMNVHPKDVYECDLCGRIIRAKSNLMKHIRIHIRNFEKEINVKK